MIGVICHDEGKIISANPSAEEIIGLTIKEMKGKALMDLKLNVCPEDGSYLSDEENPITVAINTGNEVENFIISIFNRKIKEYKWINIHIFPEFKEREDEPFCVYTIFEDITEYKKNEKFLADAYVQNEHVLEVISDPFLVLDFKWNITHINRKALDLIGKNKEEVIGTKLYHLFPGMIGKYEEETFYKVMKSGLSTKFPFHHTPTDCHYEVTAYPIPGGIAGIWHDITEYKKLEDKLKQTKDNLELKIKERTEELEKAYNILIKKNIQYKTLAQNSPDIIIRTNKDLKCVYINSTITEYTDKPPEFFIGKRFEELGMPPEYISLFKEAYHELFKTGEKQHMEYEMPTMKGLRHFEATTVLEYNPEDNIESALSVIRDITERKRIRKEIIKSLREKELLLREIHHRVKNNMQLINSILSLQSNYLDDETAIQAFKKSQERIKSISLVHETLYLSDNLASINFRDYIKKMVIALISNYNTHKIDIKFNVENITLNIETAIPCGLIINEVVTNSIKHAFSQNKGVITIDFTHEFDKLKLIMSDNGIGLPDNLFEGQCKTLGLQLVKTLVDQLNGELKIGNTNGTTFTIVFKELEYTKRL